MIDWISRIFSCISPPQNGTDPYSWRLAVFWTLLLLLVVCVGGMFVMHGALAYVGVDTRIAWTSEVDGKIMRAVEPMQKQMGTMQKQMGKMEATGKSILRALYLPQIRQKVRERCDTLDPYQRSRINIELDRIHAEYRTLAGEPFGENPDCSEV